MAFENFFTGLSASGADSEYVGIFGTTAQTMSLSSDLGSLSSEGAEIVKWVRYSLGEPKLTVELDNLQIYSAFEEASIEYSSIINRFQAKNWMANFLGLQRDFDTQDFTNKLPHQTLDYLHRLANPYATEANVGGIVEKRRAYTTVNASDTDYDLLDDFTDDITGSSISAYITSIAAARIDVRDVWHSEPSSMYRYYDPYSSVNILSQEFQYESFNMETTFQIMPIWADILRAGMLETNDRIRRSNHTYNIFGDRIRLLPKPNKNLKIWIEYTTAMDPFNPDTGANDPSITGISSISNVPFKDIPYNEINSFGKRWIRQFTLAIAMGMLGFIRRKFSSVPIPNSEVTLDGNELVAEANEKKEQLKETLIENLEETSNLHLMQQDAELAEAIEAQYQRVPFPAPILFFG
jgi:hypothetical protein